MKAVPRVDKLLLIYLLINNGAVGERKAVLIEDMLILILPSD